MSRRIRARRPRRRCSSRPGRRRPDTISSRPPSQQLHRGDDDHLPGLLVARLKLAVHHRDERDACGIGFVADVHGRASRAIPRRRPGRAGAPPAPGRGRRRRPDRDGAGVLGPAARRVLRRPAGRRRPPGGPGWPLAFLSPRTRGRQGGLPPAGRAGAGLPSGRSCSAGGWSRSTTAALGEVAKARTRPAIEQAVFRVAARWGRQAGRPREVDPEDAERRRVSGARPDGRRAACEPPRSACTSPPARPGRSPASGAVRGRPACRLLSRPGRPRLRGRLAPSSTSATPPTPRPPGNAPSQFRFLSPQRRDQHPRRQRGLDAGPRGGTSGPASWTRTCCGRCWTPTALTPPSSTTRWSCCVWGGRDLRHALAHAGPGGSSPRPRTPSRQDLRDFYRYHACLTEPWDGPAGLVFTDGHAGRGGAGPQRAAADALARRTEDGLVVCALGGRRGRHRRPRPGAAGPAGARADAAGRPRARAAHRRPDQGRAGRQPALERLGGRAPARGRRPGRPADPPADERRLAAAQATFGFTRKLITTVLRPMAHRRQGADAPPWATTPPRPCSGPPPGRSATSCASASPRSPTRPSTTCASATCCRAGRLLGRRHAAAGRGSPEAGQHGRAGRLPAHPGRAGVLG